jgi:multicomponent Na+:H+ antiporter subunit E
MMHRFLWKPIQFLRFFAYILKEIVVANIRVAHHVITPGSIAKPGVIAVPLDCKTPIGITWFTNLISLTPGTLVLDIADDRTALYIHTMFTDDIHDLRLKIKQHIEQPILELIEQ